MSRLLALISFFVSLTTSSAAELPRIVVVKSADLSAYASVVAGFSAEVRAEVTEVTLDDGNEAVARAFTQIATDAPSLVFAVGPVAANGAKRALPDVPMVFCMVPYHEKYALEGSKVTGIALTSDFSVELSTLKTMAPQTKRVGILHDPRYSSRLVQQASEVATEKAMVVVPLPVEGVERVERVLSGARGKVDAMLMVADKTVGNATVIKRLIVFCQNQGIALVALSSSQVKEGALFSVSPTHVGIGQQAGRIANRILYEKVNPGAMAVVQPESFELAVNVGTAEMQRDASKVAIETLGIAADRGYLIRAFR